MVAMPKIPFWALLGGRVNGTYAEVSGEVLGGLCYISNSAMLNPDGSIYVYAPSAQNTQIGNARGAACSDPRGITSSYTAVRIAN